MFQGVELPCAGVPTLAVSSPTDHSLGSVAVKSDTVLCSEARRLRRVV